MKKILLSFALAMLSVGSMFAMPQFKGLDNKNGKTTIRIEIPETDLTQVTVIKDCSLYNDGKEYEVKKVNIKGGKGNLFGLEFKQLTTFSDCTLSFTMNGEPVKIDVQSLMNR